MKGRVKGWLEYLHPRLALFNGSLPANPTRCSFLFLSWNCLLGMQGLVRVKLMCHYASLCVAVLTLTCIVLMHYAIDVIWEDCISLTGFVFRAFVDFVAKGSERIRLKWINESAIIFSIILPAIDETEKLLKGKFRVQFERWQTKAYQRRLCSCGSR